MLPEYMLAIPSHKTQPPLSIDTPPAQRGFAPQPIHDFLLTDLLPPQEMAELAFTRQAGEDVICPQFLILLKQGGPLILNYTDVRLKATIFTCGTNMAVLETSEGCLITTEFQYIRQPRLSYLTPASDTIYGRI